ncbi:sensor histidine kinase [Nonomuraea sp. M3C6]|uniref:histidine kinase n=1 Tax=Nonomuraea marmarensis TaxID=3351344 RepID=A0ABW7A518_9ACTN
MRRALSGIVPTALRLGAIVLLIVVPLSATSAPGLTGTALAVTLLTAALALTMLALVLLSLRNAHEPPGVSWWKSLRSPRQAPQPVALIALGLAVILSVALSTMTHGGPAVGALLISVSLVVTRFPLRQSLPVGLLAIGGLLMAGVLAGDPTQNLTLILGNCLIFLISYAAKQRKATRAAEAREAVLAERARIAREIHDILAHSLSAQLVHLEGAKLLLRADRSAEALDRVTHARDLAKSGLEEARRAVSALREDPPALPVALRRLAEDFESAAHQACTLRISGPEQRLAPETELALVRTAQEALTNVRRHAPGSPATVELECDPAWCDLRITNPASAEKGSPGGGYGLVGMRERAELLGGTLSAGERDGGFLVHLKVPS